MDAIFTTANINDVAKILWKEGSAKKVWAFHAPMGAGKTTMVHAIGDLLGVSDPVSSPTFAIINVYKSEKAGNICHMDWYRLKGEEEAIQAGVEDLLTGGDLCIIEWPEMAAALLPENCFHIYIEILDSTTRRVYTLAV